MKLFRKILLAVLAISMIGVTGCAKTEKGIESEAGSVSEKKAGEDSSVQGEPVILRFGYTATNSDELAGLVGIARDKGYFEEELGKVNAAFEDHPFVKAGPAINAALASGDLDMGEIGDVPAVVARSQGADTKLIQIITDDVRTDLLVRSDLDITNVAELKGKKVAVQIGSYMQRILYQIFAEADLDPDDVEIINMAEVDAAVALAAGSIDASPVTAIKSAYLQKDGEAKLLYSTQGDVEKASLVATIVRTGFAEEHPEVVEAFFRALIRASEYAASDSSALRSLYIKSGIPEDIIDDALPAPENYNIQVGASTETLDTYKVVIEFLKQNDLLENMVNLDTWYDGSYYEKAKESLETAKN